MKLNYLLIYRHQQYQHVGNEKHRDVFILWKIDKVFKIVTLSVDERIMALKI